MTTSIDIYSKVTDYIERNITLRELESWLVFMLPIYLSNPDSDAAVLASRIELGLAEINAEITTERLLRKQLKQFIGNPINLKLLFIRKLTVFPIFVNFSSEVECKRRLKKS